VEAELKENIEDITVELIPGSGGIFEVKLDKRTLFRKGNSDVGNRFPKSREITRRINELE